MTVPLNIRSESLEEEKKCKKRKHKSKEAEDIRRPKNYKTFPADSSNDDEEPSNCRNRNSGGLAQNSMPKSRWEAEEDNVPERQKPEIKKESVPKRLSSAERGAPKWGKLNDETNGPDKKPPPENKAKPDFGLSGKLAEEVNTYKGVVIKYSEPPEARKPKRRWRLYPFKGDDVLPTLYIHRQSAYLIGRDRKVVDLPVDHPSCSKQHAVLQYRVVPYTREDGTRGQRVRPYIIDLESANGTYVNNQKIETRKFVELIERDVIKFAYSSREYVLLHEHSKGDEQDDNVIMMSEGDEHQ
ncbi:smad nuclear-interacting protein 1 isoform X2 [Rhodnius prolixus]|uniref:smad nuclear-interacting protein 1 isoform X2 n=1 Tax=Rhodnius prolixus TaxID=13249 RepID=UPI003D188D75